MDALSYKTLSATPKSNPRKWYVIDADGLPLGRLASLVAHRLRGKHLPYYTPHQDCGDKIIVINASKVKLSGRKWEQKEIISHTGYPGGQKTPTAKMVFDKNPTKLLEIAIKGMLPKTILGRELFRNLYVYDGPQHRHEQQQPESITLDFKNKK